MRLSFQHGMTEAAEQLSLSILELAPAQAAALDVLRKLHAARGAERPAEVLLRRLVELHPNEFEQTCELALLLLRKGELTSAETYARNAVRLSPVNLRAHTIIAMVFTESHRPHLGEFHYRRALELSDGARDPVLLANLAWALRQQGRFGEARTLYEESAAASPETMLTWLGWARLEEAAHDITRASALLDRAEALAPGNPGIRSIRAMILGRLGEHDEAVALLRSGQASGDALEAGRQLDKIGRHAEAFAAWETGKRIAREQDGQVYKDAEAQALTANLKTFFTAQRLSVMPRAAVREDVAQPIFILGFPRSGTTLVEQILSQHPQIAAGDELPLVAEAARRLPTLLGSPFAYPEALSELWLGDHRHGLDDLRDFYLNGADRLGVTSANPTWFTDKMPLNETHIGLIALMFPRAPLVHVLRHPLDVVLSTFANNLTHGFNCATSLTSIARHYVSVMELVAHYRAEIALRYLPVRYEDLIDDHESGVRRLLNFVGALFDPNCLKFHQNRRPARTASYAQVAEPLYTRARYRYRHYLTQLEPVLPILEPIIHSLGYTIESAEGSPERADMTRIPA